MADYIGSYSGQEVDEGIRRGLNSAQLNSDGMLPLSIIPPAVIERIVPVRDDAARYVLTTDDAQNGDTVFVISTEKMYLVIDDTKLDSEDGYQVYMAGAAAKAYADEDGNNIKATYATKTEIPAVPVDDVQINGTSIVNNGVANVPVASSSDSKTGTNNASIITPYHQHESAFYGLAKAAGDNTQSASSSPVGTYTSEAKTAINNMLGLPNALFASIVNDGAKNKLKITASSRTVGGVTVTVNHATGEITLNGTCETTSTYTIADLSTLGLSTSTTYKICGELPGTSDSSYMLYAYASGAGQYDNLTNNDKAYNALWTNFRLRIYEGATFDNLVIKPMICPIEYFNVSPAFVPYAMTNLELTPVEVTLAQYNALTDAEKAARLYAIVSDT